MRISTPPTRLAIAATAALSRTSRRATSLTPSLARSANAFSSMSVAKTLAPSRAKAIADARPTPAAAAATNARLPFRRSDMFFSLRFCHCEEQSDEAIQTSFSILDCFALLAMTGSVLVIIPRDAAFAGDVVVARGKLHAGAGGLLADGRAIDFLPRRLVCRIGEAAFGFQLRMPLLHLVIRNQDVGAALVEVDANPVAGLQDRKAAVGGSFRCRVQDRGRTRRARLSPVADAGQGQDAAFDQGRGRLDVHDLGAAGITDRSGAAHEQNAAFVDVERGIVDAMVIIFRTLEDDGAALERVGVLRVHQIAVAEFLRNHAGLHDRGIEEVAAQPQE